MRIFDADVTGSLHVSGSSNFKGGVTVSGSQTITGSLTVDGNAKIGDQLTDIHTVTGSLNVTGSISGSLTGVLRTDYIDFNTGSVVVGGIGRVTWNDGDGTLDVGLKGGNVTLQLGQEQVVRVINNSGGQLLESNYQAVRVEGAQGNRVKVRLAQADNDANSAETLGLVTETIDTGGEGFVTTSGIVRKINTTGVLQGELWSEGDMLYLSPFALGVITNIKPEAPNHMVIIGYVIRVHASVGQIFVKVNNGYEIDELHNVNINNGSLSYGDLLMRSGSIWTNSKALSGSYQLTGSLDISGSQTIKGNQIISGSITITDNLMVLGSSSISFISQSTLNIGTNLITVNAQNPGTRFGGLAVIDSGSLPLTSGSILFDSINDQWIFVHQAIAGSPTTSSVVLMGPESFNSLGSEIYPTTNRVVKSINSEHLGDSNISDNGTKVTILSDTEITGSLKVTGGISGSIDYSYIQNVPTLVSGSAQINITGTTGYSSVSSSIATALNGTWRASNGIASDDIGFNETVIIQGGANTNVTFLPGANTFTIDSGHQSINAASSSNNSGRTYIQDILLDSFGHITGITTATETVVNTDLYTTGATFNTSDGVVTFTRNDGNTYTVDIDGRFSTTDYYVTGGTFNTGTGNLRLTRNDGGAINIDLEGRYLTTHPSVSAASSSDNSGRTYIQDILLDQYGHITGITTATETVVNTDTYTTGGTTNSTTGLITFTKNDGGTYTTSISGYVSTQIANLVDTAPTTLDTLNELAAALGDDPNFATTISTAIGNKVSKSGDTMTGNLTALKFITSGGTSSQFVKGDGSLDSSTYLTSYSETDTLATVTARGSSTATPVTFNRDVTLGNSADLVFSDLGGTFPTSGKGFDWTLNNDGARIYAIQPSSDSIDFVFQLRDNASTNDRFVFWVDDYQGPAFDKYPLIIRGGTEFDLVNSALYIGGTLVLSNGRVLQNVSGNISMFTNDSGYLTAHPSVTAASSSNNSGRTYIQDILLDSFGHITGITTATETVVDTNDFINNVLLLGNTLRFTGTGGAFSGDIDLTPFTVDNNTFVTGGTFNTGTGNLRLTRNDGNTVDVSLDGRYLTAHPSVSAASSSNNSGRTYIQDILLDSFGHITGITTATETVTDTFTTGATFNTSDGVITFTNNNGGGTFTVDIDGRFLTSYSETDTLATVTARGNTTNTSITVSGLTSNNDVVISGGTLTVYESVSGATVFAVDGTNGRLFAVTDDLSNSLFSVNTISGLPVIEAFADYHIVMGRFNQNDFYLGTTGEIGMGTAPVSGYKLAVVGNIRATSFVKSGGTSSQFLKADGSVDSNTYLTSYNNYFTTGATFNTSNGIITFNRNDGNTYTVDIDGKYAESSHTHSIDSITDEHRLFNNMGDNHSTQTDFNAITNFGARFVQGTNNGPGTGSSQFYGFTLGLGNEYGIDEYALQLALPRYGSSDKYISIRTKEASSWGSWYKIHAGYADTAGDADTLDGQHGSYYYPASNPSNYISSYVNTYTTGGTFNTGNGNLTFTRNDGGTYTVNLDGRYQASGSYLTAESDTLATVTARGASTTTAVSFNGGLTTTGFTNVSSAVLANSTGISPNSYSNRVVAGGIGDGGWVVTTGIGGNAGTNHNWSMGHNGSNFYFGISDGSAPELRTYLQVSPSRVITLNGYTTNGFLKTSSSDGTLTVDTTTYYPSSNPSNYATTGYVQTQIANLVDSAPSTLDTLNELAAALGDDPNFVTTVATSIGNKVSKSGDTMTGNLAFNTSNLGLTWSMNSDGAFVRFVSTGDGAGASYLEIGTTDNSDEEIKFTQTGNLRAYIATDGFFKNGAGYKYVFENGTWGINISGNAATVTDGVYTTGTYSNPVFITSLAGSKITGNISGNSANITSYTINQDLGTSNSPTFNNVTATGVYGTNTSSTRNKYNVYSNSGTYAIGMESGENFGGLADWAMTFQMNNDDDRGFWWGDDAHNTSQGAMALTTNGYLTVARGVRVGYGESDTTTPNVPLQVYGSGSLVFDVQGSLGQLFSVTDSLSGSLFSVNDISGLPVLEVFSDDRVVMGSFGLNSLVVSGTTTTVSGSLAVSGSATVNGGTVWHSNNDGASSGLDADLLDGQHGSHYAAASSLSSYLPLAGGTMTGKISTVSTGTGTYDTAIEIREQGYVTTNQSAWGYSPAMTFHWGGRAAIRFGLRADGLMAVDDAPIALRSWVTSQGYLTAHPAVSAASSSDNSGRTYIQDILLDSFGHITGITTATETVTDTNYYVTSASFNTSNGIITLTRNDGGTVTVDIDGRYKSVNGQTEVDVTAPAASSGSWNSATADEWGNPKFDTTYNKYTYGDAPAWLEFNIPSGMKSAWLSQLTWSSGGYVDVHGVQSGGELVFLRRINTRQTVENTDEGVNHDGSTVTFVASGLDDYTKIRLTVQSGRFHLTGLAFSDSDNEGTEGVGMVHPAQISHQGSGSGLDADTVDGIHASSFLTAHPSVSAASSSNNSGRTYIQDILLDSFGHITGITTGTETVVDTDTNYYLNSASFNTGDGVLTLGVTGYGNVTVDLDGRYQAAGSYLTAESDTLATVTTRGSSTTNNITIGALTVGGSLTYGSYTAESNYVTGADNILLKGNSVGVSGIFFESERDGSNINHPSDFGFIQYHAFGIGGSSGEANRLVIGVSNDADDIIVLNPVNTNGLVVRVGAGTTEYTVYHSGNIPTWNQNTSGNASTATTLQNTRTFSIGNTAKNFNGSADVAWSLSEIGAYAATNPSGFITSSGSISGNAATATLASTVTINYNNDSNSTYQLLWGSGNSVYGTAQVYLNPASDYVYAASFNASDWFRSSGNTGWYNSTHGGGIYQTESTMVRTYDGRGLWIDGGNNNMVQDATLYVTATNNNDWLAHFNAYNSSKTEYGIYVNIAAGATYGYALRTDSSSFTYRVDGSGRVYAPIYYDINDTAYYLNPASTSNLATVKLNSTASGTEVFTVDGVNGRLFTITDDLSDSLFSVNTIAGVPVIEAFSDYRVIMGRYNQYDLHINSSGQVAMGTSTATANYKLTVSGSIVVTPTGAWNAATPALNVGGTGDGRLQVRHIWGKQADNASTDHLWLQYQNTGNHVQIGESGGGNHLYVSGNIYMGGYFGGNLVATQSWVGSQGYLTSETDTLATVTARGSSTSTAITLSGGSGTTPTIALDRNIATPSNYYNGLQLEIRATSGAAGIGLHRNGYSHVGIYHDSQDQLKFNMNSGTVIVPHNAGTVWGSGNLTNLNQLSNGPGYITSYTETDTLSTVVARGSSTSSAITVGGLTVSKSGTNSTITFPAQTNDPGFITHYESSNAARMYFSVSDDDNSTDDYFQFGAGGTYRTTIYTNGRMDLTDVYLTGGGWFRNYGNVGLYNQDYGNHWYATSNSTWNAAGNNTSYVEIAMRTGGHQGTVRGFFYADSSSNIGILNSAGNWGIRLDNSRNTVLYGNLTVGQGTSSDIYMTDTDETTRRIHCNSSRIGFLSSTNTWGSWAANDGSWNSDQAMYAPIYYDISNTNYYLNPNGYSNLGTVRFNSSGAGAEVIVADGVNGRLFTITDDMTDSIFSVNTISGLPVIEAFADYKVVMGRYAQNDFIINASGQVSIGAAAQGSYKFTVIGGQWGSYFRGGDTGTGSDIARFVDANSNTKLLVRGDGNLYVYGTGYINDNVIWHAGNDGASSGLDADLLDGQHGSYYAAASSLSSYLPLAGGTMTGTITITNTDIRSNATSNWTGDPGTQGKIQYHSNRWYIVADQDSNRIVQFRRNGTDLSYIDNSGVYQGQATNVTVNYNNDSNSTYQMLWGSGTSVYGTAGVYVNPYYDYVYATAFVSSKFGLQDGTPMDCYMEITDENPTEDGINYGAQFFFYGDQSTSSSHLYFGGALIYNNLVVNGRITENSSIRYKKDISQIENGLEKVLQLSGVTYTKINNEQKEAGVIAEEVAKILPEAVGFDTEGRPDSVSYGRLTALLIEAIKDLKKEIDELKGNK